jgi:hypothetical protein
MLYISGPNSAMTRTSKKTMLYMSPIKKKSDKTNTYIQKTCRTDFMELCDGNGGYLDVENNSQQRGYRSAAYASKARGVYNARERWVRSQ